MVLTILHLFRCIQPKTYKFDNILIKNNSKYDDMMHIIYSDNIQIFNSNFLNAYADSIDVDISNNILLKNINVTNSGNDGVDLMESKAQLTRSKYIIIVEIKEFQ
jgi:hypothetical protein